MLVCYFNPPQPTPLREGLKVTADYVVSHAVFPPTGYTNIEV